MKNKHIALLSIKQQYVYFRFIAIKKKNNYILRIKFVQDYKELRPMHRSH